ncbi:ABC transporter permease subunit [Brachyspira sp. G79]|uniref:methionine ABC transporter permease n=1 Tax=Brachyspira sp. G79 TaxID=1358104 RepID=UPI000BBBDECC|nr:ABC transporter permease subunit [Brachyspira sp. G79]PCG18822.1 methionine ABC transporter permease [Brachyspira sp. G79]
MDKYINYFVKLILPSTIVTIRIVFFTILIGFILGFIIAVLLTMYGPNGLNYKKKFYNVLSFIVNTIRSFPILILIVAISPFTRLIIGTTIGEKAVILPLSITSTAFIARLLESSFIKVDKQLIEAAKSFGATNIQIMFGVIIRESIPSIVSVITMAAVNYIAATTIAGAVGGGGLGAVALTYGYQSFNNTILYFSVFIMFLFVNIAQYIGDFIYKKLI